MTIRLPSGSLGAEPLQPLHLQVLQRHDWLRRNSYPGDEREHRLARCQIIARELYLGAVEVLNLLERGELEREGA